MIDIDLKELASDKLYGMDSLDDLLKGIKLLREVGFSDEEINQILERSKK